MNSPERTKRGSKQRYWNQSEKGDCQIRIPDCTSGRSTCPETGGYHLVCAEEAGMTLSGAEGYADVLQGKYL